MLSSESSPMFELKMIAKALAAKRKCALLMSIPNLKNKLGQSLLKNLTVLTICQRKYKMFTSDEIEYINKIPRDKKVIFRSYDKNIPIIVSEYINKIKSVEPKLKIVHIGSSSLKISGQGDIDILVLCSSDTFNKHRTIISKVLGEPLKGINIIEWHFEKDGHDIEVYLSDPDDERTKRQLKVWDILKNNSNKLTEYESLKTTAANLSYKEYQKRKFEFYHNLLSNK